MAKYDIRLKYEDCIESEISDYVFNFIKEMGVIKKNLGICFWYSSDFNIDDAKLKFKNAGIKLDEMNINFVNLNTVELSVWYDVISDDDKDHLSKFKFRSIYSSQHEIITCLIQFKNMLIYTLKTNLVTIRKEFKDDKRRNNGIKRVDRTF